LSGIPQVHRHSETAVLASIPKPFLIRFCCAVYVEANRVTSGQGGWAKETFFAPFRMRLNFSFDEIEVLDSTAVGYGLMTTGNRS
jgi:hypothetical protein